MEISKNIRKAKALTFLDICSLALLIQVIDKYPKDAKDIAQDLLGYDKETD